MRYTIILWPEPEEGGYSVLVPALPGCASHGKSVQECIERAQEAIAGHVEALIEAGEPVPEEEIPPQAITLDLLAPVPAA
ncbi:MAG: type II toxin-antitoxin system HicB family antitoxin [Chloroflexota bacterium]